MKGVFIALLIGAATFMGLQAPIVVLDIPSSIRHAFGQEHPFASHPIYRFSTDDAGIFYVVAFKEAGEDKIAEYRYSNQDWLKDDEIADRMVIQDDPSGAERLEASMVPF